jgi:glycosyltransferase involved in cell wall biosynthesis
MKILFIAPIPPPINGQSKASNVLLQSIQENNEVTVINLSKTSLKSGFISFTRVIDIFYLLYKIWNKRRHNDIIYLSLAESTFGNIRDILIYLICYNDIKKVFVHMLGGAGMKEILINSKFLKIPNRYFLKKIGGVFVEGEVNYNLFTQFVAKEKVHIVPNFAEDFLFVDDKEINKKFENIDKIQILYLSNLINGKGYKELVEAYFGLKYNIKNQINLVFVGGFENTEGESDFLAKILNEKDISYIGKFIDAMPKRDLYCKSHIFCLPTYYPFEGQPISILEAYSTGCVVITSNHSGIPFIFSHEKNGYMVEKKSVQSLIEGITYLVEHKSTLSTIAFNNRDLAFSKYRTQIFQNNIKSIFNCP